MCSSCCTRAGLDAMQPLGQAAPLESSITNAHHGASRARVDGRAATLQCHARPQCSAQLQRHGPRSSRRLAPCTSDHVTVAAVSWLAFRLGPLWGRPHAHIAQRPVRPRAPEAAAACSGVAPLRESPTRSTSAFSSARAARAQIVQRARNKARSARRGARPRGKRRTAMHVAGTGMRMRSSQLAARARGIRPAGNSRPASWARTHAQRPQSERPRPLAERPLSNPSTVPVAARTAASSSQV